MKTNSVRIQLALLVGLGILILVGAVAYAATSTILATGNTPHSQISGGPSTFTFRNLITPPGEVGTWHYHPGKMLNVVKRGTVTVEDGCGGGATYSAGQVFEKLDGRVHRAINPGTEECEEYNLFVNPQGAPPTVFIPNNERRCGPARNVDECKDGGWTNFNHPTTFGNQGECIDFVLHQP
ncbi:MAG TPA: cupin domain-containing protein [Pyrinomonadaceae bacterium]